MRLRRYLDPRESFTAKLVVAVLATVGVLLAVTLLVVRSETQGQVELVSVRAVERARQVFEEYEEGRKRALAQRANVFTDSRRTVALLEAAVEAGDTADLAADVAYNLDVAEFDSTTLTALTDTWGEPLLTFMGFATLPGRDPAGIQPLADELLETGRAELIAYREVAGSLFTVRTVSLDLAGRPVGTVSLGMPITDADAEAMGAVLGAEICFVTRDGCLAATRQPRGELGGVLAAMAGEAAAVMEEWNGERWDVVSQPLNPDRPESGWLVMAVPLEPVLAPFDRIRRALTFAALGALLLAVVMAVVLSRGLTRPVRELVTATERVARGEYDAHVADTARDELGQLARSFNAMTEGLALKEQYRGVLDKVVSKDVAEELLRGDLRLGGESREVSILFADIRGFTTLTEGMEPQKVIGILNQTMERLSEAVEAEAGVVDKYVGDEIMAVFGAPLAQEDHAARAVRAGVAMHRAMRAMNAARSGRGEPEIRIGIGVHTGVAVAGNMGSSNRLNYTVVGEAVNLASRLCSAAPPGEFLISEAVRRQVGPEVRTRPVEELELKGFSRPVPVHAVITHGASRSSRIAG